MKTHILFDCYGCGYAGCSMCAIFNCSNEIEAIVEFIRTHGFRTFIEYVLLPRIFGKIWSKMFTKNRNINY